MSKAPPDAAETWLREQGVEPEPSTSVLPVGGTLDQGWQTGPSTGTSRPDPASDWTGEDPVPRGAGTRRRNKWGEPTWDHPARTRREAIARALAVAAYWEAMMRPPYPSARARRHRSLRTDSLIRRGQPSREPLTCSRCGAEFERTGSRGPVPTLCPVHREASRNKVAASFGNDK